MKTADQMENHTYRVKGFSCASCAKTFENNVKDLPGVIDARVNFGASKITVTGHTSLQALEKAGEFEGLKLTVDGTRKDQVSADEKEVVPWFKQYETELFGLIFLLLGIVSSVMSGHSHPMTALLVVISSAVLGFQLFKVGIKNLRRFVFDMRTLMTVAVFGGVLIGEWLEVGIVVMLFRVSELLEGYSMDRARKSIASLIDMAPSKAQIRRVDGDEMFDVDAINIGDVMVVKPGEKLAMDGVIIEGQSLINQAAITGESLPEEKSVGDDVYAGTLNTDGLLLVSVTKRVEDTTLQKIIHLVEEAQAEKAPAERFIDGFARVYTPIIMLISLLVMIVPPLFFSQDVSLWFYQGLAILIVGCPCALVVSTPISIVSAIGNAAKQGVLIKGGVHLETLGRIKVMAFDKTGTLTKGEPFVTDVHLIDQSVSEIDVMTLIYGLEKDSTHPLAKALTTKASEYTLSKTGMTEMTEIMSLPGRGIQGKQNGIPCAVQSPKNVLSALTPEIKTAIHTLESKGKTVVVVTKDSQPLAYLAIADEIRDTAKETLRHLHNLGIKDTIMLTGDNHRAAEDIASQLGIDQVRSELLPEDKLTVIDQLVKDYHYVAMVGDGVNDAPAMAKASVGIAMGAKGTDTALETADLALMADDLTTLPFTVRLSRKTLRIIKANVTFSLLIKLLALMLVIPGWLTLWLAIISDIGATLLVSLNSMRLLKLKP
ncbi:copper-translocating P-type ATPase [Halolactibacillus alkaliphilus]|uniref:Cd(2+)-exporting ATPase n=2 Tax=Halolactibacillus alkaliphilus TaxID=442899 RepID=A0A511X065_9BACI|nr:heavy metal translocating P-type ATPase [Halolactibacillus alkaliphilus]GEN56339.1 copper-translocating P-type ATPase [Halolactibacillus alkaliphilus]GGN67626.1 copper-translocating P-type ATPase [Halolactibacillus alkaliphilus]SFO78774.1 Cd2+/Zn2+-exporting ATPase [Halolactibacillus alkaliphilus]